MQAAICSLCLMPWLAKLVLLFASGAIAAYLLLDGLKQSVFAIAKASG